MGSTDSGWSGIVDCHVDPVSTTVNVEENRVVLDEVECVPVASPNAPGTEVFDCECSVPHS